MSIYATWLSILDERLVAAEMEERGINYGTIGDVPPEALDAPIVYEGSHVLPHDNDRRGGSVDVAAIPSHITRDGRDDAPEDEPKPWLRLSVHSVNSTDHQDAAYGDPEKPYVAGGDAVVVLTRSQVARLARTLDEWLLQHRFCPSEGEKR